MQKSLEYVFLILPQHEQFYPEGLSVFAPFWYLIIRAGQVSTKIQGRPRICILKFKDFQGACEP